MSDAEIYAIADRYGFRFRTSDEECMQFDKHALLEFARALIAEREIRDAIGEAIARVVHAHGVNAGGNDGA